jgi:hypothetical protein
MQLWVDDERKPPEGWNTTTNPFTAMALLDQHVVAVISLDHDLGFYHEGKEITGYDVLLHIEKLVHTDSAFCPPYIYVHTANISARRKMELAKTAIYRAYRERR